MTLKTKLISTIVACCLIVGMLITGIYAASTGSVSIGGTVSFEATDIYAQVSGNVSGTNENINLQTLNWSASQVPTAEQFESWSNMIISFAHKSTPIEIEIEVKNLSDERSLYVDLQDNIQEMENINKGLTLDGENYSNSVVTLLPNSNAITFTISFEIANANLSVHNVDFRYIMILNNVLEETPKPEPEPDEIDYSYMTFEYDYSMMTAKLTGFTESAPSEVVVPSIVSDGVSEFTVTAIGAEGSIEEDENSWYNNCVNIQNVSSITLPETLESIHSGAFHSAFLTSLHIPASVHTIGSNAFVWSSIDRVTCDENNENFYCINNCLVVRGSYRWHDGDAVILATKGATIEGLANTSVKTIGDYAFSFFNFADTTITIPENIVLICKEAFSYSNVEHVIFKKDLGFGEWAFAYSNLITVTFEEKMSFIESLVMGPYEFCDNFTTIYVPADAINTYIQECNDSGYTQYISKFTAIA